MINVLALEPGTTIRLVGDATAEVVSHPRDGEGEEFHTHFSRPGFPSSFPCMKNSNPYHFSLFVSDDDIVVGKLTFICVTSGVWQK